jgi:hypothetical protein
MQACRADVVNTLISITEGVWKGMSKVDVANLVEPVDRIRLDAAS